MLKRNQGIPEALKSSIKMSRSNQDIEIYKGRFLLKRGELIVSINGRICFKWAPHSATYFKGVYSTKIDSFDLMDSGNSKFVLEISGKPIGEFIISFRAKNRIIYGWALKTKIGITESEVTRIVFSIPNLQAIFGTPVKRINDNGGYYMYSGRIEIPYEDFVFTIDSLEEHEQMQNEVKSRGGYIIQYTGEISKKDSSCFSYDQVKSLCDAVGVFLSFVNGRRTSLFFLNGFDNDTKVWEIYHPEKIHPYKDVQSWYRSPMIVNFNQIWESFSAKWFNLVERDMLKTMIETYTHSLNSTVEIEYCMVLALTSFENLYYLKAASDKLNATDKLRKLLTWANIPSGIPDNYLDLINIRSAFISNNEFEWDGPAAIVSIRNFITHTNTERIKQRNTTLVSARIQAWQLTNYYQELLLLHELGYDGQIRSRILKDGKLVYVPWVEQHASISNEG